jgi:large subunit ribosomal protein L9
MKIVMRQDVPKVGEAGTIQTVSNGYARNYLIPKGLAVVATDGELKVATHNIAVKERKITRQEDQLRSLADKIDGQRLVFTARAGDQGRLYGSITATDVATSLAQKIGEDIDRRRVVLDDPLRTLGEHSVTLHLVGRLRPQITVVIEAEHVESEQTVSSEAATTDGASDGDSSATSSDGSAGDNVDSENAEPDQAGDATSM